MRFVIVKLVSYHSHCDTFQQWKSWNNKILFIPHFAVLITVAIYNAHPAWLPLMSYLKFEG